MWHMTWLTFSPWSLSPGLVDREDITCGLFPVQYTKSKLAFTAEPALPNAANTAFLSLVYAGESTSGAVLVII